MLANNMVLTPKDFSAVAEALSHRQPGDKMRFEVEVTIVENLPDRATFDICSADPVGTSAPVADAADTKQSTLAESVLGVMAKKGKSRGYK